MLRPETESILSSLCAALSSRLPVRSIQALSAIAFAPAASAGPDTAHGPSAALSRASRCRRGERKPKSQTG